MSRREYQILASRNLAELLDLLRAADSNGWGAFGGPFLNPETKQWNQMVGHTTLESARLASDNPSDLNGTGTGDIWIDGLSGSQRAVLDSVTRSGLLGSFAQAISAAPHNGMPSRVEKYFIESWLKLARPRTVPKWALIQFQELFPGKYIQFFAANLVGAVIASGEIGLFVPLNLVTGTRNSVGSIGPDANGIRQWVKTKMGYVPAEAKIVIELAQVRSRGELAIPDIGGGMNRHARAGE